ncbi:gag protease polyprotein [Cucumis melo var. makuwa]|uniref:Gag protease polyprotein n=1 Tax=Cucumis melo var. makuwa TaxID=1194695 RepID=A0A5A7VJ54_CUCMM|nr:gag protease polyprotein [Cucumis melo var. makuwa]
MWLLGVERLLALNRVDMMLRTPPSPPVRYATPPFARFLLHPTGHTSPTGRHPTAAIFDRPSSGFQAHSQPSTVSASVVQCASEVTLEFKSVMASVFGTNSPLFGKWIRLDADLNKILATFQVRIQRGADRRGARRMRKGHTDASAFLYASADVFCYSLFSLSDRVMVRIFAKMILATRQESLVVVREMPPRRGARRGGREGRGRGAGRVQPGVQPVAQATDPATPVTHADLAAMEQRFRDLIMQMQGQQQPAPPAPAQFLLCPRSCQISCRQRPST